MRIAAAILAWAVALSGCAPAPRTPDPDPDMERVRETLEISEQGPTPWSPAVTVPLYPVLLVADTSIKFAVATYNYVRAIFGGNDASDPVPERLERQAEKLPKN